MPSCIMCRCTTVVDWQWDIDAQTENERIKLGDYFNLLLEVHATTGVPFHRRTHGKGQSDQH